MTKITNVNTKVYSNLKIAVEGPDCVGKSSIISALVSNPKLSFLNRVQEPGGTVIAESIRKIIIDNNLINKDSKKQLTSRLFEAARADLYDEYVNKGFISDRCYWSQWVYQYTKDLSHASELNIIIYLKADEWDILKLQNIRNTLEKGKQNVYGQYEEETNSYLTLSKIIELYNYIYKILYIDVKDITATYLKKDSDFPINRDVRLYRGLPFCEEMQLNMQVKHYIIEVPIKNKTFGELTRDITHVLYQLAPVFETKRNLDYFDLCGND